MTIDTKKKCVAKYAFWIDMISWDNGQTFYTIKVFANDYNEAFDKVKKAMPPFPEFEQEPWKFRVKNMEEVL